MGFGGDPSQQAGACRSLKGLARAKSRGLDSIEHVGQELLPGTREMGKQTEAHLLGFVLLV